MLRDDSGAHIQRRQSVLVVEDDTAVSDILATVMTGAGYEVRRAFDGASALRAVEVRPPELVLLDVGLPDLDGLDVLRQIRRLAARSVAVIVISGRSAEHQRLAGFAAGADDYVVKPFSPGEVAARAAGILRRLGSHAHGAPVPITTGPLHIEPHGQRVTYDGRRVVVTPIEFGLLAELASRPAVVRTRDQLILAAWGDRRRADSQTVTVHIQRLRRKLAAAGAPPLIETVHGLGYRLGSSEVMDARPDERSLECAQTRTSGEESAGR